MKSILILISVLISGTCVVYAQHIGTPPEYIINLTSEWEGDRLPDGRPDVPDELLERLKHISIEEAWGVLQNKGYRNQYEGNWMIIHPDSTMTGRVVTAQYMPLRPDLQKLVRDLGIKENRTQQGMTNSWPIEILTEGDVYVADAYGKINDGPLIGDNLGNAIYANSKRGVIFNGSTRDMEGLHEIKGFNGWFKGQHPSAINQMILTSINMPIRIGEVTVFPGDVVLAKKYGTVFIPAHLLVELVITSEFIALRDKFGHQRLREGIYTPGAIDSQWSDEIKEDFFNWLDENPDEIPMTRHELDELMSERTW